MSMRRTSDLPPIDHNSNALTNDTLIEVFDKQHFSGGSVDGVTIPPCDYYDSYKYKVTGLSDDIKTYDTDNDKIPPTIANAKAVHDYINALCATSDDSKLAGEEGQVVYVNPDGTQKQTVLHTDVYLCESQEDQEKCKKRDITFAEIYKSWLCKDAYNQKALGYDTGYNTSPNGPLVFQSLQESLDFVNSKHLNFYNTYGSYPFCDDSALKAKHLSGNGALNCLSTYEYLTTKDIRGGVLYQYYFVDANQHRYLPPLPAGGPPMSVMISQNALGYPYWVYNSKMSSIVQPINAYGASMYVSPTKYSQFEICAECYSTNGDDDWIGLVAYVDDPVSGKPVRIDFVRNSSFQQKMGLSGDQPTWDDYKRVYGDDSTRRGPTWTAQYNCTKTWPWPVWNPTISTFYEPTGYPDIKKEDKRILDFKYISGEVINKDEPNNINNIWKRPWSNYKCTVWLKRHNYMLSAATSKFVPFDADPAPLEIDSTIGFDLTELSSRTINGFPNYLSAMNDGCQVGFVTCSQPNTYWKILSFNVPKTLIRTDINKKITITPFDRYPISADGLFTHEVGIGRFVKNTITDKTFYVNPYNYLKITDSSSGSVKNVQVDQILTADPKIAIATINVDNNPTTIYAPTGGSSGSTVSITSNYQNEGNEIATITVNGTPTKLYTGPLGGGGEGYKHISYCTLNTTQSTANLSINIDATNLSIISNYKSDDPNSDAIIFNNITGDNAYVSNNGILKCFIYNSNGPSNNPKYIPEDHAPNINIYITSIADAANVQSLRNFSLMFTNQQMNQGQTPIYAITTYVDNTNLTVSYKVFNCNMTNNGIQQYRRISDDGTAITQLHKYEMVIFNFNEIDSNFWREDADHGHSVFLLNKQLVEIFGSS